MPDTPADRIAAAVARLRESQRIARDIGNQLRAEDEQRAAQQPPPEVPR